MRITKERLNFTRDKVLCWLYLNPLVLFTAAGIVVSILERDWTYILTYAVLAPIVARYFFLAKKGCLLLIRLKGAVTVTMSGNITGKSERAIFDYFKDSFQRVFTRKTLKKIGNAPIKANTHKNFVRGVFAILADTKHYSNAKFQEDVARGYAQFNGERVEIKTLKERKNKMLSASYPLFPSDAELTKYEEKNTEVPFFEISIPASLLRERFSA